MSTSTTSSLWSTSINGKPLAVSVSDLWWNFPFERLPETPIVAWLLQPQAVLTLVVAYLASKPLLMYWMDTCDVAPTKHPLFRPLVAFHNLILAVFSAVMAVYSWTIVGLYIHNSKGGIYETYCDEDFFTRSGFEACATIFYISKYYEFVDTWILILKGKQPSFLQLYHHVGIVLAMWGGLVSHSSWLVIVVCFNSVIHTLMYVYFFVKTHWPTCDISRVAQALTRAQIGQFVLGIVLQCMLLKNGGGQCDSPASQFMYIFIIVYALGLIGLFLAFASKRYKPKNKPNWKKKM